MQQRKEIYRGYDLQQGNGQIDILKDGQHLGSQPSWEFAYKWVDQARRAGMSEA